MSKKKKIFIVEDEDFTVKFYKNRLTSAGYEVLITSRAVEAMRLIKEFRPDLIVVDLMLKDGNGFSLIQDIHNASGFKKIPIWVLSNLGQDKDIRDAIKKGANKYFVKSEVPFQEFEEELKKKLK